MAKIEFVSYDGMWPNYCAGTLVIKVDDKEYSLRRCLRSGGSVTWPEGYTGQPVVTRGPWMFHDMDDNFPKELEPYKKQILEVVNEKVPFGCCGGCI